MDSFDQNPANFASTSLACGAIAIDPANPDRIYVGNRRRRYRRDLLGPAGQRVAGLPRHRAHPQRTTAE